MSEWQPIETAPLGATKIMVWDGILIEIAYGIAIKNKNPIFYGKGLANDETYLRTFPTHWMPLPEPPCAS